MFLYLWMMIQVLVESLPISSSGHVALMHKLADKFNWQIPQVLGAQGWAFDYILQGVSAILFLVYFFIMWWKLVINRPVKLAALVDTRVWKHIFTKVLLFGIVADAMTFLCWVMKIDERVQLPLALGFSITGLSLWSLQCAPVSKKIDIWDVQSGLLVGLVQGCALLPGISRFGTTFTALRWMGYKNDDAFAISFLIQWPLIVAGALLGLKTLIQTGLLLQILTPLLLICMTFAGITAYCLLCVVYRIIDKNVLWKFSYYMIIPVVLALMI